MDCGPSCLKMIADYYGAPIPMEKVRLASKLGRNGVSMLGLKEAAEQLGFNTQAGIVSINQLINEAPLPCILHWAGNHFVVLMPGSNQDKFLIADPAKEVLICKRTDFLKNWVVGTAGSDQGLALLLEPSQIIYEQEEASTERRNWSIVTNYLKQHRRYLPKIIISLFVTSIIQFAIPLLAQKIVDTGIPSRDMGFVSLILAGQLALLSGRAFIEFVRNRILLYISTRINFALLTDFWNKYFQLPIQFHETTQPGDIMQRLGDYKKIETFLTGSSIAVLFSLTNIIVFSIVLFLYNLNVFYVFLAGSILYFFWIWLFLGKRRELNYKVFEAASTESTTTMQMIRAVQDIKINNAMKKRKTEWQQAQTKLFKLSFKSLSLSGYQQSGTLFLSEGKNLVITYLAAKAVMDGSLTLGAMLAIQYIIGQLNGPVEQLAGFMQTAQDAALSLKRINELDSLPHEDADEQAHLEQLPASKSIHIKELLFTYPGAGNEYALKGVNLEIPEGKTTAIVGMSGSGKTTLLKLLLRYYDSYQGAINVGEINLRHICPETWRSYFGTVMQDGFIYNDTISGNIVLDQDPIDYSRLVSVCHAARILSFIEELPQGFNTKLGLMGMGLSQGQKQRILIARAIYRDPHYLLFDEATNALDATNEHAIVENLKVFFKGRTVVIVAHRLSTVRDADNIVVMHMGQVVECGTHENLVSQRGPYYELIKNQLELGN